MRKDVQLALRSSTSLRSWLLPLINLMERRFFIHGKFRGGETPAMTSGQDVRYRVFPFANPFSEAPNART
jgi:hypothetical protein